MIPLIGKISEVRVRELYKPLCLTTQKERDIVLSITSIGGDVDAMFAILDMMEYARSNGYKITTVCQGYAYSAAGIIFALGDTRLIAPHATVMLHRVSYSLSDDYNDEQSAFQKCCDRQINLIDKLVSKKCGVSLTQYKSDMLHSLWLNAAQAIKYGVADGYFARNKRNVKSS